MKIYSSLLFILVSVTLGWSQQTEVQASLVGAVKEAATTLVAGSPNHMDPLSLNATVVWSKDKTQLAVLLKAELLEGWHTYAYVPETQPYIETKIELELPKGITKIKDWEEPYSEAYSDGIYVYKEELVFVQYCAVAKDATLDKVITGLYYQTCDIRKCFPPVTKVKELKL
ncbi:protein-disulfide reductase DsbD N-terminal domain-containing protein [Cellulophaga sp. 20_2_10]|uniref:protein-disulfide reductase DsbD domain-containing protein n=1 Tax=Cellulophaga sp. 20_2_10 TaxID=2942476 RepID=UPI00201ACE1B|nr:protein-disulfide reductase DsbD domain-containing protein [Cellulophaga sp. 20_2_10]MCL5246145.1 protein-disulfide reductase DsbD N-terminal domain-containing protein [Cellulophaga sp. 20_2_10]